MARVAARDRELWAGVDEVLAGQPPHYEGTPEDEFNADVAASVAGTSLEDVITEAETAHRAVMEKLASIPPERWEVELPVRWQRPTGHVHRSRAFRLSLQRTYSLRGPRSGN